MISIGAKGKWALAWCLIAALSACTSVPVEQGHYSASSRSQLYQLDRWAFEGRLALTGENDSWSASISWGHGPESEKIKLAGPLGQGATVIQLTGGMVTLDRGDGRVLSSDKPETFINQQLGMFVPVQSLRYWVIGLPEPTSGFVGTHEGFNQAGWIVGYQQMQAVGKQSMPRKVTVTNGQVKLKLIIDEWSLNGTNEQ